MTVFGRYGLRTRQASNLVVRLPLEREGWSSAPKGAWGREVRAAEFFASLVSAGQKPAEQRADSLVAATPSGDVGERSDGLVFEEQSSAKPYLRFGPGTLPLLGALPFAGRSYFKGARSLELGERFSKAFCSASDDRRVLESRQGGERVAHLHLEGGGSPSLVWLGPCRSKNRSQQWLTAFGLQCCRPVQTHTFERRTNPHGRVRVSYPERR